MRKELNDLKGTITIIAVLCIALFQGIMLKTYIPTYEPTTKDHGDIPHWQIEVVDWNHIGELKPNQIRGIKK